MRKHSLTHVLAIAIGDEPPTEIKLFEPGQNSTTKGSFLFDATAAELVMAAAKRHAVDCMIDLEHLSLDGDSRNFDPDARGWGQLAVKNGALFLVNIKWNEDGERRIRGRTQRYVSPAFEADSKTGRITRILNVAITALPATDGAQPLIAANQGKRSMKRTRKAIRLSMDPELVTAALDALEAGDSAKALEILKSLIASAAGAAEAPAEPEGDEAVMPMAEDTMDPEKKDEQAIAAAARTATGKKTAAEVTAVLQALSHTRTEHTTMAGELASLKAHVLSSDLRELVRSNPKKIASPKMEALVLSQTNIEAAKALVDALPEVIAPERVQNAMPANQTEEVKLTEADVAAAKLMGNDPAKVLDFKKAQAKKAQFIA